MLKTFLFSALFALAINFSFSQSEYPYNFMLTEDVYVGQTPLKSYFNPNNQTLFVICYGYDENFNSIFDSGDEFPSIWSVKFVDGEYVSDKIYEFEFAELHFPFSPLRPAFDELNNLLYLPLTSKIKVFDMDAMMMIDELSIDFVANSLALSDENNLLYATLPYTNNSAGTAALIDINSKQIQKEFYGGVNILEVISYSRNTKDGIKNGMAVLAVGDFGSDKSIVYYGDLDENKNWNVDSVYAGNTANNLLYHNDKIYVAINMDHKIGVIDIESKNFKTFATGTNAYNGPREMTIHNNYLFVSTYLDNRIFDLETGQLESNFGKFDKYENINFISDTIAIVTVPSDQMYSPNNFISIARAYNTSNLPKRNDVTVGKRPLWLYFEPYYMVLHILCQGEDKNSNGLWDAEDELPSYWQIKGNGVSISAENIIELPFNSLEHPLHPVIDQNQGIFYLPQDNFVGAYKMNNIMNNFVAIDFKVQNLDLIDNYIVVTPHNSLPNNDSLYLYEISSKNIVRSIYGGENIISAIYCSNVSIDGEQQPAFAVLNKKDNDTYEVNFIKFYDETHKIAKSIAVNKANSIHYSNNNLFIAHDKEISIIKTETDVFKVDYIVDMCTGKDVITGLHFADDVAIATLSNGKMHAMEIIDNTVGATMIKSKGNISSLSFYDNHVNPIICASNIKELDGSNSNKVSVWGKWLSSVEEIYDENLNSIKVSPNPASEFANISLDLNSELSSIIPIKINSLNGELIAEYSMNATQSNIEIPVSNLANGLYLIELTINNKVYYSKLNIVR